MTKMRLGAIMKKRKAVEKYLKNDVADLLKNGLDYNAYGRAEGLLIEQNRTVCYGFIHQYCDCIPKTLLSIMQKQRDCPEECREAVSSLMYAAARFADLPELRDLRTLFTEKYGDSVESFLNKEFVEKLRADPPTKEMKLKLMHNIAAEISIEWDPKALEQKLFVPPSNDSGYRLHQNRNDNVQKRDNHNSFQNDEGADTKNKMYSSSEDDGTGTARTFTSDRDLWDTSPGSVGSASEDDEKRKPLDYRSIPAPYVKPNKGVNEAIRVEESRNPSGIANSKQDDTAKPKPRSVRRRPSRLQSDRENNDSPRFDASLPPKLAVGDENLGSGPARAGSLPVESTKQERYPSRASSMSPDMHVHPRLPDFDDLATRVAALQGI